MPDDRFAEARCRRCGRCCHEKFIVNDRVVLSDIPCQYLDPITSLCRIYAQRHALNPRCQSAEESLRAGGLPAECPYTSDCPDYVPPLDVREHTEYAEMLLETRQEADKPEERGEER